jgi:hypothetical protein
MKIKYPILFILFLSTVSLIWFVANGESDSDHSSGDKIKEVVDGGIKNVSNKAKESGVVALDKIKEVSSNLYQSVQDEGGELLQSYVLSPAEKAIDKCIEKAVSAGISALPEEKVKQIIETTIENSCECP